jgi:hypothetical protein
MSEMPRQNPLGLSIITFKNVNSQWLMPAILVTQEALIRRIIVQIQPR